ncbi:hypothetical protein CWRG_02180 [Chthonomonas calidirosea]|uniref:anti-sigma factor family protein n=1 Tax=Chthonomonas calidirosea TaxID=454171 RepID=UPI0006DD3D88|nr:hypothetical protein [Chthonomonas calidirosea]CEK18477.1 hypothetical protein CWRG_02180 [Chthonomonas calidirosea]
MMEHQFHEQQEQHGQKPLYLTHSAEAASEELCLEVRRYLPELLENDGSLRPDQAVALNVHLAVCTKCAQEFALMQQVVMCLEELPMLDPPSDFSDQVLRRLQFLAPPVVSPERMRDEFSEESASQLQSHLQTPKETLGRYGLLAATLFMGVFLLLIASAWGRLVLGANLEIGVQILREFAASMRSVPLLGWLVANVLQSLAASLDTLLHIWQEGGSAELAGVLFDIALLAVLAAFMRYRRRPLWRGGM